METSQRKAATTRVTKMMTNDRAKGRIVSLNPPMREIGGLVFCAENAQHQWDEVEGFWECRFCDAIRGRVRSDPGDP